MAGTWSIPGKHIRQRVRRVRVREHACSDAERFPAQAARHDPAARRHSALRPDRHDLLFMGLPLHTRQRALQTIVPYQPVCCCNTINAALCRTLLGSPHMRPSQANCLHFLTATQRLHNFTASPGSRIVALRWPRAAEEPAACRALGAHAAAPTSRPTTPAQRSMTPSESAHCRVEAPMAAATMLTG